jgi:hypothetical protein
MEDIKITLESLYDILRNEKKREDLQKLESTFFMDVVSYLREKKNLLESKQDDNELFASGERDKLEYELRSIKRILKEIYEKREKKIIDISLNKSRTGSDIIDTSAMLIEEKDFYKKLLTHLDIYRRGILLNLYKGELPAIIGGVNIEQKEFKASNLNKFEKSDVEKKIEKTPEKKYTILDKENTANNTNKSNESDKTTDESEKEETKSPDMTKIRFIHPMPSFVWKDMKVYGPFDKGEEIDIFPEVAELIVRKGRAEKV